MGIVKYNNVSTTDLGLIVQAIPDYDFSEKDITFEHIRGRNGDLIINDSSFKNITRTYYLAKVFRRGERFVASSNAIVDWLHSANNYVRLEDSYEPEYYRLAIFKDQGSMRNYYDEATTFEVNFECKPQKWLKVGDEPITIDSTAKEFNNPTNYDSLPIIEFDVTPNDHVLLHIGNQTVELLPTGNSDHIIIDCENMECYSSTNNYNKYLKLNADEFPTLTKRSKTSVSIQNGSNATIKPRWWTL